MIINKNPFVVETYLDDVLILVLGKDIYSLEGSAIFIWEKINKGILKEKLLDSILEEFVVSETKAKNDLNRVLKKLETKEMVKITN